MINFKSLFLATSIPFLALSCVILSKNIQILFSSLFINLLVSQIVLSKLIPKTVYFFLFIVLEILIFNLVFTNVPINNFFRFISVSVILLANLTGFYLASLKDNFLKSLPIFLILIFFVISTGFSSAEILSKLETFQSGYNFDGFLFLNTAYLIGSGQSYQSAYKISFEEDIRFDLPPTDFWGWRPPTIFYLWSLLPNGFGVWTVFIVLSTLALFASYKISYKEVGDLAIFVPLMLSPYFFFGATTEWFLEVEWWGLFFFIFGLFFWKIAKIRFSWISFLVAILIRELFVIPILVNLLGSIFFNKKRIVFFSSLVITSLLFLVVHFLSLREVVGTNLSSVFAKRLWGGGWPFIQQTLAFGSNDYLFINFRILLIYTLVAATTGLALFLKLKFKIFSDILLITPFSFLALYFFAGSYRWHEYWGITYIPFVILLVPKGLRLMLGREKGNYKIKKFSW